MKKYCIYYTTSNGDCKHMMVNATSAKNAAMIAETDRGSEWGELIEVYEMTKVEVRIMKRYKVYVYNTVDKFWDCYEVNAIDPVDARNVAVQRLIDETGHGLDVYEVTDVCEIKD